jgi:hypothetical protein
MKERESNKEKHTERERDQRMRQKEIYGEYTNFYCHLIKFYDDNRNIFNPPLLIMLLLLSLLLHLLLFLTVVVESFLNSTFLEEDVYMIINKMVIFSSSAFD